MNLWSFAASQLAVKLPAVVSVACAGVAAWSGKPWYTWAAFLATGFFMNQALTLKTGKASEP